MSHPSADQRVCALVAAAGAGTRLGQGPKAFLPWGDATLCEHVMHVLEPCVDDRVIALPADAVAAWRKRRPDWRIIAGGDSRHDTYARLLAATDRPYVLMHDVSRPLASRDLITSVIRAGHAHGAAGAFVQSPVPAALPDTDGVVHAALTRDAYLLPQSPQCVRRDWLQDAFDRATRVPQSTWELLLDGGYRLHVVDGEPSNIKLTTAENLAHAHWLASASNARTHPSS